MGLSTIHSVAFWVEECTCNIFLGCCHCIQIFHSEVPTSLYGLLASVWYSQGSCGNPATNAGAMSRASNRAELQEVHFLRTIWDIVGSHCVQARIIG